ncbi:hypothetical protein ACCT11_36120, partial [Rhizobium johnstonii]|uniref:hypothetical protein n=1 Tax=Rhizobium johnstonii TaxID=3019933 RepID=UPI003F9AC100
MRATKMALILCADEVWRERRSEFCILWSEEQTSHVEALAVGSISLNATAFCNGVILFSKKTF